MREITECFKYEPDFKRLTKANSTIIGGRVIVYHKKSHLGKPVPFYCAYDYKTKILLHMNDDKSVLVNLLYDCIDELESNIWDKLK